MARVADKIEFHSDENGWEMYVYPADGGDPEVWNVHAISADLILELDKNIGQYYREGLLAARQHALDLMRHAFHESDAGLSHG